MPLKAYADSTYKELDIVVIIPAEFYINPNTKSPLGITTQAAQNEVVTAINVAAQYYKALNIKFNIVKVVHFSESNDPYYNAYQNSDAYQMLETSIERFDTYGVDYDVAIVVGRGYFKQTYGLAYEGVSCTHRKFSQVFVTTAGVSEQKKYSFAHSIAHEIGHVIGMSHYDDSIEGQASIMASNYHAKPYGFSQDSILRAQTRLNGVGGECLAQKYTNDTDADGFTDEQEEQFGSDLSDHGSLPNMPSKAWYSSWNSFLNLINIIELLNRSDQDNSVEIKLKDIYGKVVESRRYVLKPYSQFDVILNEWSGFAPSSYGSVEILATGVLDGRVSLYSIDNTGTHKFSTSIPFIKNLFGISNLTFNSFFPHAGSQFDYVQNWLTLVNLDSEVRSFRVSSFDSFGSVVKTRIYSLAAGSRLDVDGGHEIIDATRTGMHEIVPNDLSKPYIAYISRYGMGGNKDAQAVKFASVQIATSATGSLRGNTVITKSKGYSYLEVLNAKSAISKFSLKVFSPDGSLITSKRYQLPGFAQMHIGLSEELVKRGLEFGAFTVQADEPESISSELYNYKLGNVFGDVVTANLATPEIYQSGISNVNGSYNLFLQANNYVFINNFEPEAIELTVKNSGNVISTINLPANSSKMLSLRDLQYFSTRDASYGTLEITSNLPHQIGAALLREGSTQAFAGLMLESNFR
jgi:hypothetical protein